jgi:hypothetical protein
MIGKEGQWRWSALTTVGALHRRKLDRHADFQFGGKITSRFGP